MHTWIKICGTTCLEDALQSVEAGADALGFIFAPSKRRVTPDQALQIISGLPPEVEKIGVFMNSPAAEVASIAGKAGLTGIQMHGDESSAEVYTCLAKEQRDSLRKIKTILVKDGFENGFDSSTSLGVDAWLFDSGAGSGKTFDWQAARTQLGNRQGQFILAGGLTPENVGEAIPIFKPWGVDVVSGVESAPGKKDPEKLKAFVAAVRRAEQQ
ncbi:MAG TPA: phosphoribosylanthranilate isomerase [Candidatus Angelobacter sp.]|jgi:phosphoribosylanthranilate isomerase|nr:phosphoribosylanthranilate isomerase [Candidatus Angelobacter sp.]